ncbi:MAG: DUF1697 domain-containing protein [Raineya sp.]|jgi:uncharacterized protein (DUF1697 family)|nr:DUF1697 domain-containing protein [Raineya sp.]
METYISLLRGINVSGKNKILMADLKAIYENIGLLEVQTYIQSGNVIFKAQEINNQDITKKITEAIFQKYGFQISVFVENVAEIERLMALNPIEEMESQDYKRVFFSLLSEPPKQDLQEKFAQISYPPDEYYVIENVVFWKVLMASKDSKLSNNLFENKLKVIATTRNWNTMLTLINLSKN